MLKPLSTLIILLLGVHQSFANDPFNDFSPKFKSSHDMKNGIDKKLDYTKHERDSSNVNGSDNHASQEIESNNCKILMQQNSQLIAQNQYLFNQNVALQEKLRWQLEQSHSPFLQVQPQPQFQPPQYNRP